MIGIVVVAYNRPHSLQRLLCSLNAAFYDGDVVDLIVSIDKGPLQNDNRDIANKHTWSHGSFHTRALDENHGLRKHVLLCGDLVDNYDSIIMLEDDITVSADFYQFAKNAITAYNHNPNIAGISLYAHKTALPAMRPFIPSNNGNDVYFLQFAQSWGQCWSKEMWKSFRAWYHEKESLDFPMDGSVPLHICKWNDASWLKFYMWYIVERNLYFVYPYCSRSTNHSEKGTHQIRESYDYMVPLSEGATEYRLPLFDNGVQYDAYFERINLQCGLQEIKGERVCIDLYGKKMNFSKFDILISTAPYTFSLIREMALKYHPHEMNCIYPTEGKGIFVYDLNKKGIKPMSNAYYLIRFDLGPYSWKKSLLHGVHGFIGAIAARIERLVRKIQR